MVFDNYIKKKIIVDSKRLNTTVNQYTLNVKSLMNTDDPICKFVEIVEHLYEYCYNDNPDVTHIGLKVNSPAFINHNLYLPYRQKQEKIGEIMSNLLFKIEQSNHESNLFDEDFDIVISTFKQVKK